ncbi:HNH endonuclease [Facklamia hominis]|uniref:HNH endonuclease n=1 Tax=Facklamia hominis TaxID=178214 RepID=UPI00288B84DE|nr:HNH endonuclease [Facklamia hominis]
MDKEIWKPILGYENRYKISNNGNIVNANGRPLKQFNDKDGYKLTSLYKDGKSKSFRVHKLVYEAFNGRVPSGKEINHLNFNRGDNRLVNLDLLSRKDNVVFSRGNMIAARNSRNSKVTVDEVNEIRNLYASDKYTQAELAKKFGLKKSAISSIVNYESWKNI